MDEWLREWEGAEVILRELEVAVHATAADSTVSLLV